VTLLRCLCLKIGQLVRRIDLYELNVDNMNRLIIDPVSHGVIVTDGGNKKIWAIGPDGEKKSVQYRPWRKKLIFLLWIFFSHVLIFSVECRVFNNRYFGYFTCRLFNFSCC
jgi:hypothetical protein